MTNQQMIEWLINNLLNESQLDVIPPGETQSLRFWMNQNKDWHTDVEE